jgi:hypothetical protein
MGELITSQTELFPGSSAEAVATVMKHLNLLEVHKGCGRRPCRICMVNSPYSTSSLPFDTITEIFRLKSDSPRKSLMLFNRGDPIYYSWQEKTLAEVIIFALEETDLEIYFRTHGYMYDDNDEVAHITVQKLAEAFRHSKKLRNAAKKRLGVSYSLDPYGAIGSEHETDPGQMAAHIERLRRNIAELLFLNPSISAFYNENCAGGFGGLEYVGRMVRSVLPGEIDDNRVFYEPIIAMGRAMQIEPCPPLPVIGSEPWCGYYIDADGGLNFKYKINGDAQRVGSIFEPLTSNMAVEPVYTYL